MFGNLATHCAFFFFVLKAFIALFVSRPLHLLVYVHLMKRMNSSEWQYSIKNRMKSLALKALA